MNQNQTLKNKVREAIRFEPFLEEVRIKVTVEEGVITLSGTVDSYVKKSIIEQVVNSVSGVHPVIEKIKVEYEFDVMKTDETLTSEILELLKLSPNLPESSINFSVINACVTLSGNVKNLAQKEEVERVISSILGVRIINNNIIILPES
ncbi:osmotically-inducible protein OsmY [Pedobacter sp. UYP30]|uniref:BON domain-containing protein n=1 Tax=Pedobacter sp. UYP30 TaxID=1756400 RepID=UPI0033969D75